MITNGKTAPVRGNEERIERAFVKVDKDFDDECPAIADMVALLIDVEAEAYECLDPEEPCDEAQERLEKWQGGNRDDWMPHWRDRAVCP